MDGTAPEWFSYMESSNLLSDWVTFATGIHKRFDPNDDAIPGGKLSKVTQTSTVAAYQAAYETQANKVVGLPEWFLLEVFISGLREDIQQKVLKFRSPDIQEAMVLAKTIEAQILGSKSVYAGGSKKFSGGSSSIYKKPFQPLNNKTLVGEENQGNPPQSKFPNFKRLNAVERRARREKGLCFDCDEKFSAGHRCKGRLFRLSANESEL